MSKVSNSLRFLEISYILCLLQRYSILHIQHIIGLGSLFHGNCLFICLMKQGFTWQSESVSFSSHRLCPLQVPVFFHVSVCCLDQESGVGQGLEGVGLLTHLAMGVFLGSHSTVSAIRKMRGVGKKHNKEEASACFQSRIVSKQALSIQEFGSWQPGGKRQRLT